MVFRQAQMVMTITGSPLMSCFEKTLDVIPAELNQKPRFEAKVNKAT